ncbi:MAG: transcription antitermination factor NusB [Leptonema sp. (in: bacteria)]
MKKIIIKLKARPKLEKKSNSFHPNFNAREIALQGIFQMEVSEYQLDEILQLKWVHSKLGESEISLIKDIIEGVVESEMDLDSLIQKYSKKDIRTLSNIVKCVLRMGIYEILKEEFPAPIVIDTYCTLTRKYDSDHAVKFVNAILDKINKDLQKTIKESNLQNSNQ